MLQRMVETETELRLREFLCELGHQEGTGFSPPTDFSLLSASAREPCPIPDLRVQAVRRLDECLTALAHVSENGDLVEICVATMWNIARPCLGPATRRHIYRSLQKVGTENLKLHIVGVLYFPNVIFLLQR